MPLYRDRHYTTHCPEEQLSRYSNYVFEFKCKCSYLRSTHVEVIDRAESVILHMPAEGGHAAAHIQPRYHDTSDQLISNVIAQHRPLQAQQHVNHWSYHRQVLLAAFWRTTCFTSSCIGLPSSQTSFGRTVMHLIGEKLPPSGPDLPCNDVTGLAVSGMPAQHYSRSNAEQAYLK